MRVTRIVDTARQKRVIREHDGLLYACRYEILQIGEKEGLDIEAKVSSKKSRSFNLLSRLVFFECMLLNNRGVILRTLEQQGKAERCFEEARRIREYFLELPEEKSTR